MSKLSKKSVINTENFLELKTMMLSNDEASVNLALTIVEQSDYDQSEIYILCMLKDVFKEVFGSSTSFEERTPDLAAKIAATLKMDDTDTITKLSFKNVYDRAILRGINEEVEFVLSLLTTELISLLGNMGYEFINFTDVLVKPKGWEKDNQLKLNELKCNV